VKTSENLVPPAQQHANNDLRDLRELRGEKETSNSCLLTPNSSPRVQLDAPVITGMAMTANSFTVTWSAVPAAYSYTVAYSKDATFSTGSQTGIVNAPGTSYTVPGREPDTIYYVRVKSYPNLPGDDTASDYSATQAVRTLADVSGETPNLDDVTQLQEWLNDLQMMNKVIFHNLPDFANAALSPKERRRSLSSGVRRYGFIDKVSDTAVAYPEFWPADIAGLDDMKAMMREIEVLRNLMILFRKLARLAEDRFLTLSNEAFLLANAYYASVRIAARRKNLDAEQVFQMLRSFWLRPRKNSGTPTRKKLGRNAKAVAEGKRDGEIYMKTESDTVTKGQRIAMDNSYPKGRGVKVKETEYLDASGNTTFDTNSMSMDSGK
jgi:hypothetical protein